MVDHTYLIVLTCVLIDAFTIGSNILPSLTMQPPVHCRFSPGIGGGDVLVEDSGVLLPQEESAHLRATPAVIAENPRY